MPYNPKNPLSTDYTVKDLPDGFTEGHVQQLKDAGFTQRDLLQYGLMSGPRLAPTGPVGGFTGGGGTPPSSSLMATGGQAEPTNYFAPMFRLILGSGGQQGTPGPGPGPTGPTGSVMRPLQLPSQQAGAGNLVGSRPSGSIPPPNPMAATGLPSNLPGISGGPPTFGTTPVAPPAVALPSSNVLNPIPVQLQPVQQYQQGGFVTSGDPNTGAGSSYQAPKGPPTMYAGDNQLYQTDPRTGLLRSNTPQVYANAQDLAGMMGAAALYSPYIQNVQPSGSPSSKSGVAPVGGALMTAGVPTVPQGPWLTNPGLFAKATPYTPTAPLSNMVQFTGDQLLGNGDPHTYQVDLGAGVTHKFLNGQLVNTVNNAHEPGWQGMVNYAMQTGVAQPINRPAAQPTGTQYAAGTPFATPPAAPGYTLGSAMPQTSMPATQTPWLAQGGMGGGGQPSAWGIPPTAPAQGAGGVPQAFLQAHTSALADAGKAMYSHFGGDPNAASPADIANFHTQLSGAVGQYAAAGVKKAATGGLVPGRGNEDTVPALLTPGEYVIPKQQVEQLVARGALKMQSGGFVPDDQSNVPPEARRQPLTTASQQPSSSSAQSSTPQVPTGGSGLASGLARAAQTYGSSMGGGGVGGGRMGGAGGGYSADTLGKLGDEGLIGSMGLGKGFGGGGGMDPKLQNALGGIGSGLTQAANAIASSVQPWQMQQSAIPDPSQLPKYQVPTLQQTRVA